MREGGICAGFRAPQGQIHIFGARKCAQLGKQLSEQNGQERGTWPEFSYVVGMLLDSFNTHAKLLLGCGTYPGPLYRTFSLLCRSRGCLVDARVDLNGLAGERQTPIYKSFTLEFPILL